MKRTLLFLVLWVSIEATGQIPFSISTHLSGLRNFTPRQKFWTIGQQVQASFYFTPKQAGSVSLEYYREGKFKNNFTATAKSILTNPQSFGFTATGRLTYRQVSLGLKHYLKGSYDEQKGINIFGMAGLGFLFARSLNSASSQFDTTRYHSPIILGRGSVRRLSFDAGVGAEMHVGSAVYAFTTVRAWLPASYQRSRSLHNSDKVPLALMAGAGIRILFDFQYY